MTRPDDERPVSAPAARGTCRGGNVPFPSVGRTGSLLGGAWYRWAGRISAPNHYVTEGKRQTVRLQDLTLDGRGCRLRARLLGEVEER